MALSVVEQCYILHSSGIDLTGVKSWGWVGCVHSEGDALVITQELRTSEEAPLPPSAPSPSLRRKALEGNSPRLQLFRRRKL